MKVPWKNIIGIAGRVGAAVLTGVPAAELFAQQFGRGNGEQKLSSVLALATAELQAASLACGRDLSLEPRVVEAVRRVIESSVELHNALATAVTAPK